MFTIADMVQPRPSESLIEARRKDTEGRILDAAMLVMSSEGVDALSIRRLSKELGCSVGAVYRYFASKDAIVVGCQARVIDALREDLAGATARRDGAVAATTAGVGSDGASDPVGELAQILAAARVYAALPERRPVHFRLLGLTVGDPRQLVDDHAGAALLAPLARLIDEVGGRFDAARVAGALDAADGRKRAMTFWAALHGVLQTKKLARFGIPGLEGSAEAAEELVETLLIGWGADPKAVAAAWRR